MTDHPDHLISEEDALVGSSTVALFSAMARRYPDTMALELPKNTWTYRELEEDTDELASAIRAQSTDRDVPIPLIIDDFGLAVVAAIGIMKSGHTAVVLNNSFPEMMLEDILDDVDASLVVTEEALTGSTLVTNQRKQRHFLTIEELGHNDVEYQSPAIRFDDLALLLFTSGSSGIPKGVMRNHRFVLHEIFRRQEHYDMRPGDRVMVTANIQFARTLDIVLTTLLSGGTVIPFLSDQLGVHKLPEWINEQRISVLNLTGSLLRSMKSVAKEGHRFPALRIIRVGAETIFQDDLEIIRSSTENHCLVFISFGATEAGVICGNIFPKDKSFDSTTVPVGRPVKNKSVLILDQDGNEVGTGETGEIVIESTIMADGYWRRPDETEKRFRRAGKDMMRYHTGDIGTRRPDGLIVHLGRLDQMTKIRGHRVEITGIEAAMMKSNLAVEAAVVVKTNQVGNPGLIAHVVLKEEHTLEDLRDALQRSLPEYMIPAQMRLHDTLPKLSNGKINRKALNAVSSDEIDSPLSADPDLSDPTVQQIASIWKSVLGVSQVRPSDNFYDLGGDSITAAIMIAQVQDQFAAELSFEAFVLQPTINTLAQELTETVQPSISSEESIRLKRVLEGLYDGGVKNKVTKQKRSARQEFTYFWHSLNKPGHSFGSRVEFLFKSVIKRLVRKVINPKLSYKSAVSIARLVARSPFWSVFISNHSNRAFNFYHAEVRGDQEALRQMRVFYLLEYLGAFNRLRRNLKPNSDCFAIHETGRNHLEEALTSGKGVILLGAHTYANRWLQHLNVDYLSLPEVSSLLISEGIDPAKYEANIYYHHIQKARQWLAEGKVIHIVADGKSGHSKKRTYSFLSGNKSLRTGFAELALITGAHVIPVLSYMETPNQVVVQFGKAFNQGLEHPDHLERVDLINQQYLELLEKNAMDYPWQTYLGQMEELYKNRG